MTKLLYKEVKVFLLECVNTLKMKDERTIVGISFFPISCLPFSPAKHFLNSNERYLGEL